MADVKGGGRTVAVLGDMLELGGQAERVHREIGRELARAGTDYLLTTGALGAVIAAGAREAGMPEDRVVTARDQAALARGLRKVVRKGDVVLVKGSRGTRMERVLELL
jgi:UDP-N-acetylmuramyl pentapeptide synthase